MLLVDEKYEPLDKDTLIKNTLEDENKEIYYWTYSIKHKDFFLEKSTKWYNIITDCYKIKILDNFVYIPSNYYIIIGELEIGLDVITPDEVVGRDFSSMLFERDLSLSKQIFEQFKIVGFERDYEFVFPLTNNIVPVIIGDNTILVSTKNVYSKMKHLTFSDFI